MSLSADEQAIDGIIRRFFECFDNGDGSHRLDELADLCSSDARIAKAGGALESIPDFIRPRAALLTSGRVVDFREREVFARTTVVRDCAQRLSTYEKTWTEGGRPMTAAGHKFFHLVRVADRWRIVNVLWQD